LVPVEGRGQHGLDASSHLKGELSRAMMLAVEFADFGFGTVFGAVVAGSIAIVLNQRAAAELGR
jgi:hypothetical protein